MDQKTKDEFRVGFEIQLRHLFYSKPEFPYLQSMGCYHVFFQVKNDVDDFGFLILEWECLAPKVWNWVGTWVDTQEELENYKYKRESPNIDLVKIAKIVAKRLALAHHKNMMRQQEIEDFENWSEFHKASPKPFLN